MAKYLVVIAGPDKGKIYLLDEAFSLLVGRSKHTETRLTDPRVSPVHCEIEIRRDRVIITDLDSSGGTWVNGNRVTERQLSGNDIIRIGDTQLRLHIGELAGKLDEPAPAPRAPAVLKPLPVERLHELVGTKFSYFEIGPVLAKSQSGLLFRAKDFKNERIVAFKVLSPEFSKNEIAMQRFVRAMKTMMPVRHPNLVNLYGAGKAGPYCWVSMELVEGESLTQVIQRIGTAGMLDWRHALRVAIHIGRALSYAHERHIIHRNITPQNVMIRASDKMAKLGDLMLAKAQEGNLAVKITRIGEVLGDIRYMSPEQMAGSSNVDGRSDIYSLGSMTYALLTGRTPFEGETMLEMLTKIRLGEAPKPKKYQLSIPDQFEGVVMKMLAKRPEERFQSALALLADLERVARLQGFSV